jgi:Transcriptional regulator
MSRTKKDFEGKRRELLHRIWEILLRNGYENATLALIIKELGLSKGVFYHYFKSKEECADSAIDLYVNLCVEKTGSGDLSGMSAEEKLKHVMLESIRFFSENKEQDERINAPANAVFHQKLMIAITKQMAPQYAKIISDGVAEGVFDTGHPQETAEMILTLANFYLDAGLFRWQPESIGEKILTFAENAERMLGAKKGTFSFICYLSE